MKRFVLFIGLIFLVMFSACDFFPSLPNVVPVDGKFTREVANSDFLFDMNKETVKITNYNAHEIDVVIESIGEYVNQDFILVDTWVFGHSVAISSCRVQSGDHIKITVVYNGRMYLDEFTVQ